ncbi:MAG: VCBS repeat-containing protein [Acidobacteria bacterium]|jgi:hypothetical protein|nr:VCBS repeat-containing protein [Acidobacteriota bacterium]
MKATTQSIFGLIITVLMGATFFGSVSGQTASLVNEQAVKHLRETSGYDSLQAAFNDARKRSGDEPHRPEVSQTKLTASDGAAGDLFGSSVAISGDTAIVGSYRDDIGANVDQGSAYVFVRSGTTWTQQTKLTASDGAAYDDFGNSVAISGNTVIVGSYRDYIGTNVDQGSAYIFVRSGTTWTQQTKLIASDGASNDLFGVSVAISGETAIVGSSRDNIGTNIDQGSAYIFVRSGTTWTQQTKLTAADGAAYDFFGVSVAISGGTAIVGSYNDDIGANANQGSAYVFVRSGTTWTQQTKLTASDGAADDDFGNSVAISGETAIVGSYNDAIGANAYQGSAYIFVRSGTIWTQQTKLTAADGAANDAFGFSVAISGDTAIVGSYNDAIGANNNQGSAYVFVRSGTIWTQQTKLIASDGAENYFFGVSVAISGGTAIVGSSDLFGTNTFQGSAYVFNLSNTRTLYDFDGDGRADLTVFRASNGFWYELSSQNNSFIPFKFGQNGDRIAPADYDGDGRTDFAVFRDVVFGAGNKAYFYITNSSDNSFRPEQFGATGDVPVSGDWDGDGKADLAVYRDGSLSSGQGYFFYRPSSAPGVDFRAIAWGTNGDKPVVGDFDGDSKQDAAVFRPSNGVWYILQSSNNQVVAQSLGIASDIPAPADFNGDGRSEIAVFRPSNGTWYTSPNPQTNYGAVQFGASGDLPVPADYDGDGRADIAVFRPSNGTWYLLRTTAGFTGVQFGNNEDKPIPNAYIR